MADSKVTALTALTTPADEDLLYTVDDPAGTPVSKKITWTSIKTFLKGLFHSYKVQSLGANPTTVDADSVRELNIEAAAYTANTTTTFSNVTNLNRFTMQLTNTNANVLTFAGVTMFFKTGDLPENVTFAANALTFPADSAIKYNLVAVKFDGSTFDSKIEIRE